MSLISKILTKKDASESISPLTQFEIDLDAAIGKALARGASLHTVISTLESRENSARHRLAANLRF
jgi:hypothetical protein